MCIGSNDHLPKVHYVGAFHTLDNTDQEAMMPGALLGGANLLAWLLDQLDVDLEY